MLAARLRPRLTRAVWLGLLAAGVANALVLNLQPYNLIHSNLVHYFLGAKYPFPYQSFYRLINAAQEEPQIGMRDLGQPDRWVRESPGEQRAYYIDLMRQEGLQFDPLAPLAELGDRARRQGVLQREARRILSENLPAERIEDFRRDVRLATSARIGRDLTHDAGFNGSPFYALVRHVDPTLYRPIGRETAWLNLAWQTLAVLALAWIMGSALGVGVNSRLGMAALVFASWDFVSFAFPGLIFAGLFLPVAVALYAMHRRAAARAGVAVAWAGLIKLFPFVLLVPAGARLIRSSIRRIRGQKASEMSRQWLRLVVWCALATGVLGAASLFSGRSWPDFFGKITAQFASQGIAGNNVSVSRALSTLGIDGFALPALCSVASLGTLTAMFLRGADKDACTSLPRRSLILFVAMGWVVHNWLNYYSVAVLLVLPLVARRRRVGAAVAAAAMALASVLPEFNDPRLATSPTLLKLKLAPYILVPAWLVFLEFHAMGWSTKARRIAVGVCICIIAITAGEAWRMHAVRDLGSTAHARLVLGDADGAIERYQRLLKLSPWNAAAYNGRAVASAMQGDLAGARADFERAVRLRPQDGGVRRNYGRLLLKDNKVEAAAREFEVARRLAPYDETILLDLARSRLNQGRYAEAESLLTRALELAPANEAVDRTLRAVRQRSP
jgi:tetratricopeptide (TPR) repeat protein